MAYGAQQIENHFHAGKSRSNKYDKLQRNRKVRRKLKLNPDSHPQHKQYSGWEF